jgi:phospholipid N-methyltransferase
MILEQIHFFSQFLKYPRMIGSITPSSPFLARAMVAPVPWEDTSVIVELGSGTGIFTQYIQQRRKQDSRVYLFEKNTSLRKQLMAQYPAFSHHSNAEDLSSVLYESGEKFADTILSGLPFTVFPVDLTVQIMDEVMKSLKPGGLFITFQFSLHMKKQLLSRFSQVQIKFVPLNILPAFVYICRK